MPDEVAESPPWEQFAAKDPWELNWGHPTEPSTDEVAAPGTAKPEDFQAFSELGPTRTDSEYLTEPLIPIPTLKGESTLGKIGAGTFNVVKSIPEFMETPVGLATLPLAMIPGAGPVMKGLFAGLAAKQAGEKLGEAAVSKDVQDYTEGILGAAMAPAIGLPEGVLPRAAKAAIETISKLKAEVPESITETKGPSNALDTETAQTVRPVRDQSIQSPGEVPAEGAGQKDDGRGDQEQATGAAAGEVQAPETGQARPLLESTKTEWADWVNQLDELTPLEKERAIKNLDPSRPGGATPEELERWKAKLLQIQLMRKVGDSTSPNSQVKTPTATPGEASIKETPLVKGESQLAIIPGGKEFLEQDVIPTVVEGAKGIAESAKGVENILSAPTVSESAGLGAGIIREKAAELARKDVQGRKAFAQARNQMAGWNKTRSVRFIDAIEGGRTAGLSPELQRTTTALRDALNQRVRDVRAVNPKALQHVIQDYFPHIWKKPSSAATLIARIMGKRPLMGTKSFLKQRTIPRTVDGITAGLEPVTYNPIDLTLLKLHEMDKYVMGQKVMQEFKDQGLAKFSPSDRPPPGYAKINDAVGNVIEYRPTKTAAGLPGAPERVIRGHWFVQEDAARVLNNYLSPGLERFAWYRGLRWFGNALNMANLGLSAYHFTFSMIDASTSKLALGIEQLSQGKPIKGLSNIARGVAGLPGINQFEAFIKGNKVLKEYTKPGSVGGDYPKIVDSLMAGGGRVEMPQIFQNSTLKNFFDAAKAGNYPGAVLRAPAAAIHAAAYPLMNVIIPRMKLGIFTDMARHELERIGPGVTRPELRKQMGKIWDSVDNRLGELVYDNLFWNKTLKDTSFLAVRSVGWNLGTLRELGGGVKDSATIIQRLKKGEPAVTRKMAYTVALPITVGVMGAMYQYLRTGKGPQELKDYFYPKTGNLLPSGEPERVNFPSYLKDVESIHRHPIQTVLNKAHPSIGLIGNMLQNKDYFGTEVIHPDDPLVKQVGDEMAFVAKSFVPYTAQGMKRRGEMEPGIEPKIESFFGIMPLPSELTRTRAENLAIKLMRDQMPQGSRTQAQFERSQNESKALAQIKMGRMEMDQAVKSGLVSPERADVVDKRANQSYLEYAVSRLSAPSAMKVFENATPKERQGIADLVYNKIDNSKTLTDAEKELLQRRFDAIMNVKK